MQTKKLPSVKYLLECFDIVDTKTESYLVWKRRPLKHFTTVAAAGSTNARCAGKRAGRVGTNKPGNPPYYVVMLNRKMYYVHRIMWKMRTSKDPGQNEIDHEDGNSLNNKKNNHRCITGNKNMLNKRKYTSNKSGVTGVFRSKHAWTASIRIKGKQMHLGSFSNVEDAAVARKIAEKQLGFHDNHGSNKMMNHAGR